MYSAFSLRSPSCERSSTSCVTRGRSTVHSWSSSARSFLAPSGVMYRERAAGGGRSRVDIRRSISGMLRAGMGSSLLIVVGLLIANGLFSGAEIAILSVRSTRLKEFIRRRDRRALAVKSLRDTPERFLATVQIAMTTIGTTAAAIGGADLEQELEPMFHSIGLGAGTSLAVVIILVTFLELVIGELLPKSLGLRYSDRYAFVVARPLVALSQLMRPLVWFLTLVSNTILRLFGDRTTFTETRLSRDELQQLVEEAAKTRSAPRTGGGSQPRRA